MIYIAWDIETCPLPLGAYTETQQRRYQKELRRQLEKTSMAEEEASRLVRSLHPMLGWTCCISAVRASTPGEHHTPRSWTASAPGEEADLLRRFWDDVSAFRNATWITAGGKRFDAPFILSRSAHHHIEPSRFDLLNTYPYRNTPHTDLLTIWPHHYSLDDLCSHLSVPSPKTNLDGSGIAQAIADGHIDDVEAYCAADAIATLQCFQAIPCLLKL